MKAEQKERKMSLSGWVIVGLLDTLAGVIAGELVAFWALPYAYNWRGYMAIGGEWILILLATAGAAMWMHSLLMDWIFGGKKDGKVRSVSPSSHRSGGNRGRVRRDVKRWAVIWTKSWSGRKTRNRGRGTELDSIRRQRARRGRISEQKGSGFGDLLPFCMSQL